MFVITKKEEEKWREREKWIILVYVNVCAWMHFWTCVFVYDGAELYEVKLLCV